MNIEQLQMFLEVSELGSFQKVAERNFISQRAVSKRMRRLEEEVGVTLFIRQKNRIELTTAGRFFAQRCQRIVRLVNDTNTDLQNLKNREQPRLTIGYFSPFDAILLRQGLAKMEREIDPVITEEGVEHLLADVLIGDLDCAFVMDDYGFA